MIAPRRAAAALAVVAALASAAAAQQPEPAGTPEAGAPKWSEERARELFAQYYRPIPDDPAAPGYYEPASASVLRYHKPVRRTAARADDRPDSRYDSRSDARYDSRAESPRPSTRPADDYGVRNPGGVGRRAEYYPPGNTFQNEGDPTQVAGYDTGVGPSREDQYRAAEIGIRRNDSLQRHIDRYARPPFIGFGFGFGGFGGPF